MKRLMVVGLTLMFLAASGAIASVQNWSSGAVASWTPKQIDKFLSSSPWAGRPTVERLPSPFESTGEKVTVTWESATLVQLARQKAGHQRRFLTVPETDVPTYAISVRFWGRASVLDYVNPHGGVVESQPGLARPPLSPLAAMRLDRVALVRTGRPALSPIRAHGFLMKKNGDVIDATSGPQRADLDGNSVLDACGNRLKPSYRGDTIFKNGYPGQVDIDRPAAGADFPRTYDSNGGLKCDTSAIVVFEFPATDTISREETVEFRATGWLRYVVVSKTFVIRDMVANGSLDLR